jgi:uncharacterized protein (TIGR00251 family)
MCFHDHPEGLLIDVRVQPKSAHNAIVGEHDGALKIKLNAPPVEGKANKALMQCLAKWLRRPKSSLEIVSGQTSRTKRILVRIDAGADLKVRRDELKHILEQHTK